MTADLKLKMQKNSELVECELKALLERDKDAEIEIIFEAERYSLLGGGKRIRPFITMEVCRMLGGDERAALRFACALEMIHVYSLIHDDLPCMDNDELRRGMPTVHVKFGEGIAVLIGDALLNLSVEVFAQNYASFGDKAGEILKVVYQNSGATGMIAGQCVDLVSEGKKEVFSAETLNYLHLHKTGCLIKAPIVSVGVLAGVNESVLYGLSEYAENLGLAFQITDDVLDVEGDESIFGKPIGSDAEKGKLTYPAVFGLERSKEIARECVRKAVKSINVLKDCDNHVVLVESILNRMK